MAAAVACAAAVILGASAPAAGAVSCGGARSQVSSLTAQQVRTTMACVLNVERTAHGLPALAIEPRVQAAAQGHTDDMAARGYFGHYNPDGWGMAERLEAQGYDWESTRQSLAGDLDTVADTVELAMGDVESCRSLLFPEGPHLGVGFAHAGAPYGGPLWTFLLAWHRGTEPASDDYAPYMSCPHTLRGDYGLPPDETAPVTRLFRAPRLKLFSRGRRTSVRFTFGSSEPGSSFRCKLDARPYAPCSSPKVLRVGPGRHAFRVVATDGAGNADASPVRHVFRVRRR